VNDEPCGLAPRQGPFTSRGIPLPTVACLSTCAPAGALALGTEQPAPTLLHRRPYSATASLISLRMWRHIGVQAAYQLTLLLTLLATAEPVFGINTAFLDETGRTMSRGGAPATAEDVDIYRSTLIFNAFVFAQVGGASDCGERRWRW
jgi:magnesium-transporting ATPase (P-type)